MPDPATRPPRDPRYDTARWARLRTRIIKRDGGTCVRPGCQTDTSQPRTLHVDHIHEVRDDGAFWDPANLETLCRTHHSAKTLERKAERPATVGAHATIRRSRSLR